MYLVRAVYQLHVVEGVLLTLGLCAVPTGTRHVTTASDANAAGSARGDARVECRHMVELGARGSSVVLLVLWFLCSRNVACCPNLSTACDNCKW